MTKMSEEAVERGKKRRLCDVLMWTNNGMRMTYAGVLLRGVARESQRCAACDATGMSSDTVGGLMIERTAGMRSDGVDGEKEGGKEQE